MNDPISFSHKRRNYVINLGENRVKIALNVKISKKKKKKMCITCKLHNNMIDLWRHKPKISANSAPLMLIKPMILIHIFIGLGSHDFTVTQKD